MRGKVRLTETEGGWLSRDKMRIDKSGDPADMPVAERDMLNALFAGGDSIEMDKANHVRFRAAQSALQKDYDARHKGNLFLANAHWSIVGLMLVPAAMLAVGAVIVTVDPYAERTDGIDPAARGRADPARDLARLQGAAGCDRRSEMAVRRRRRWPR